MEIGERERGGQASSKREEDELKRGEKKKRKKKERVWANMKCMKVVCEK